MASPVVSDVSFGARSVSFVAAPINGTDQLSFATIRAALLAAGGSAQSPIAKFLGTSHTDAVGTGKAMAQQGITIDYFAINGAYIDVAILGDNSLGFDNILADGAVFRITMASALTA